MFVRVRLAVRSLAWHSSALMLAGKAATEAVAFTTTTNLPEMAAACCSRVELIHIFHALIAQGHRFSYAGGRNEA